MAAEIKVIIPASSDPRIVSALSWKAGYQATITNADGTTSPNPVKIEEACRQYIISRIKSDISDYESSLAAATAATKVRDEVVIV